MLVVLVLAMRHFRIVDWRGAGRLSRLMQKGLLTGELGEVFMLPAKPGMPFDRSSLDFTREYLLATEEELRHDFPAFEREIAANPRSRSAIMRVAERTAA